MTPGRTTRLAVVGHSLGAIAVSYLQAVDERIQAVVALDKLSTTAAIRDGDEFDALGPLEPVVPALGVQSEYGFTVAPVLRELRPVRRHGRRVADGGTGPAPRAGDRLRRLDGGRASTRW